VKTSDIHPDRDYVGGVWKNVRRVVAVRGRYVVFTSVKPPDTIRFTANLVAFARWAKKEVKP